MPSQSTTHKLKAKHRDYILYQYAALFTSPAQIARDLSDPVIAEEYGFKPVNVERQAINYQIKKLGERDVNLIRIKYLENIYTVRFANKKQRLIALQEEYENLENIKVRRDNKDVPLSDLIKLDKKMAILKQFKDETNDDVEKLTDALDGITEAILTPREVILSKYRNIDDADRISGNQEEIH